MVAITIRFRDDTTMIYNDDRTINVMSLYQQHSEKTRVAPWLINVRYLHTIEISKIFVRD